MVGAAAVVLAYVVLTTTGGDELHWNQAAVPFDKNSAGSADLTGSELTAIDSAFQSWNDACGVGYSNQGTTSLGVSSVNPGNEVTDGNSIVTWQETGWVYGPSTIGITFTWFDGGNGVIGEADMLLNGDDYVWSTSGSSTAMDVEAIVAHEAGHYLGLGHTGVSEATMFATVADGETKKRSLHSDDINGGQHLYGPGGGVVGPGPDEGTGCGCTLSPSPVSRATRGTLALLALALGVVLARKRETRKLVICVAAILGFASTANATVMMDLSPADLARESDSVVLGTVERVETWTDGRTIQTSAYVVVHEVVAGADHGTEIEIRTPGGELPAGVAGPNGFTGMVASGIARFTPGDEVLVFLADRAGALRVSGLAQGKFLVSRDGVTGDVRLYRDTTDLVRMAPGPLGLEPVTEDALDGIRLEDLKKLLAKEPAK